MAKTHYLSLFVAALSIATVQAQSPGAATLRFNCEGDSLGAAVSINGQFKGECPFDVSVAEGNLKISAVKPAGPDLESVFEQELRVGSGTVKRIEIVLGAPQATRAARERVAAKAEAERLARLEDERRAKALMQADWTAADHGDVAAMLRMADKYANGVGVAASPTEALAWLTKAAAAGNPEAMFRLGEAYENGRIAPRDSSQALVWYRKAAEVGHPGGMGGLGAMYYNGQAVPQNYAEGLVWFRKAAAAGNGRGMNGLANSYDLGVGGLPKDPVLEAQWRARAVEAGDPRALSYAAALLLWGENNDGDSDPAAASAAVLFRAALASGQPDERRSDPAVGVAMLRRAVASGLSFAMTQLGYCYEKGKGVAQDDSEALRLYQKAADFGEPGAMNNLGYFYDKGRGGLKADREQAVVWYRKAAALGESHAISNLAKLGLSAK